MAGDSARQWLPQRPDEVDSWFGPRRFALILFVLLFAAYPEVVLGRSTFFYRDFNICCYPWAHYQRECFWRGELPFWNPLNNCGIPFLAQWSTMSLYPLSLFYLLLPLSWSLGMFCLAHIFLGGLGTYFLAHRWTKNRFAASIAGVALAFNGMTMNELQWPNYCAALGWMPWVVLSAERAWQESGARRIVVAALVGAMQMFAGAPELILLTWMFVLALNLAQMIQGRIARPLITGRFFITVVLVAMLAAIQLLPFLDLLAHSQRGSGFGKETEWSMPAWGLANLLVPLFYTFEWTHGVFFQYDQYCTSSYYAGVGVLAFAVIGVWCARSRRVWLLAAVCLLSVALAMGGNTPFYTWLGKAIPFLGFMRYPVKFALLFSFLLPLLAAFGSDRLLSSPPHDRKMLEKKSLVIWISFAALITLILWIAYRYPKYGGTFNRWPVTLDNGLNRLALVALTGGLVWYISQSARVQLQWLLRIGLLLAIWLDLLTHVPRQNPTVPRWVYEPGLLDFTPQPKVGGPRAMTSPAAEFALHQYAATNAIENVIFGRKGLYCDCNLIDGIPKVTGVFPMHLREPDRLNTLLYGSLTNEYPRIEEFLGVAHINTRSNALNWEPRANYLPLVTAGQRPTFAADDETLRAMFAPDFDARSVVYLPLGTKATTPSSEAAAVRINVREFSARRIVCEAESDKPAILVVAQSYHENWHGYVDNTRVPLLRANFAFQALPIPKGSHHVVLIYEDPHFRLGALFSGASLAVCLVLWFRSRRAG